jgi:hypothetical protein
LFQGEIDNGIFIAGADLRATAEAFGKYVHEKFKTPRASAAI